MNGTLVARGAAAIVDASAGTPESWQGAVPAMEAMYRTIRVETAAASPPLTVVPPGPAGKAVAGRYRGSRMRQMADQVGGSIGGRTVAAQHFCLRSADGWVYRFYDVPSGDLDRFDFPKAAREEPENTGRYGIDGGTLLLVMGGSQPERLRVPMPRGGRLEVGGVLYVRE